MPAGEESLTRFSTIRVKQLDRSVGKGVDDSATAMGDRQPGPGLDKSIFRIVTLGHPNQSALA